MKKRILSFFLAALMIIGCVGTFAIGASAAGEMTLSVVAKVSGNKVNVQVKMSDNPGFAGINFKVQFDKNVIRPIGTDSTTNVINSGFITTNLNDKNVVLEDLDYVTFVAASDSNYTAASGKIIGYDFELLDAEAFTTIELVLISCADENKINVVPEIKNTYIGQLPLDDLTLESKTVTYNGRPHSLEIVGLGDGMKVEWTVNGKKVNKCEYTNAGTYEVTAVVSKTGYKSATLTATLVIEKANARIINVVLWPAAEGTVPAIKSLENAQVEIPGVMGWDLVAIDPELVLEDGVYKLTGVVAPTDSVILDTTVVVPSDLFFAEEEELVENIIEEAQVSAPIVSPQASKLPVPAVELPYGYYFEPVIPAGGIVDAEGNVIVDEEGNILRPEENIDVDITYVVKNEQGDIVKDDIVLTIEITKKATGADLATLLLYYHKKLEDSQKKVETVKADVTSATVAEGTKVTLTTATAGAVIHYTTDGSTATVLSPVYTAPIVVNEDVVINAIATKTGMKTSAPASFSYTVAVNSVALKADAANIKYMDGRGDNFEPNANATRYEVIEAIANLFDIKTTYAPLVLTDVADEYVELVNLCTAAGIIKGYEDKTFRGNESITRAEVATIICNVMKLDVAAAKDAGFKDVSGWATNYVNACANAGYVKGKAEGEFAPSANITRAELATLFNNITGAKAGTSCSYADVDANAWYFGYVAAAAK